MDLFRTMSEANISSTDPSSNRSVCTKNSVSVSFPIIFMTVGVISNSIAFVILVKAYKRFQQKWRASFLLFASGLVFTDCLGHLVAGAITVRVYALDMDWQELDPSGYLCSVLGTCMVFFGLSALFLGSVMALERCLKITHPFLHSTKMTIRCAKFTLGSTWLFALCIALLPNLNFGEYTVQCTLTWCFMKTKDISFGKESGILLLFSLLGLSSLGISLICNTISGITLVRARVKSKSHRNGKSQHVEMLVQLVTIMCVSCVCWGPFLVTMAMIGSLYAGPKSKTSLLMGVRMAAWNQILDPWVYILLRRAVLRRVCKVIQLCLGKKAVPQLNRWRCSTFESSIKIATMDMSLRRQSRVNQAKQ
ncbi:prostaglandin F2-alpha receptor-like [Hypanus sabinus]|uniref:prostaglandin F2-alpha receptor-like n=1 Tax=Hypanus sabinus TaxID=79690 RepID=UPI0028C3F2C4|nr:prostaglandin F2-alpha receptor-like [Hypanus sabinus]XP_059839539.1 prostaglandin F2-alpha receptor-like [Hypanus sabinus]XP_059839540.1 prostaglandin F2-alpha receptor-like [Hypanus sabinus]